MPFGCFDLATEIADEPNMKQTPQPETAARAYKRDIGGGAAPFCDDDGAIIVAVTLAEQAAGLAEVAELPKFIDEANRLAAEALAHSFPGTSVPELAPEALDLRPLRALVRAIEQGLPNLTLVLARAILDIELRAALEGDHASEAAQGALLARYDVALEEALPGYKDAPLPVLCGLSQHQWTDLNYGGDWLTKGPLRLDTTLSLADLEGADLVRDARFILTHLRDTGPLDATDKGQLSPEALALLWPRLRLHNRLLDRDLSKGMRERLDLWPWVTRELLEGAELIALTEGAFQITKRGREMLGDDRAGALFVALFVDLSRGDDLSWFDRWGTQERGLNSSVAGFLYLLSLHGKRWKRREWYVHACWPEPLRDPEPVDEGLDLDRDGAPRTFEWRILKPLVAFGLMEARRREVNGTRHAEYRTTPLFHRFLRFYVTAKAPSAAPADRTIQ